MVARGSSREGKETGGKVLAPATHEMLVLVRVSRRPVLLPGLHDCTFPAVNNRYINMPSTAMVLPAADA
jgi:hypothetical protein